MEKPPSVSLCVSLPLISCQFFLQRIPVVSELMEYGQIDAESLRYVNVFKK